MIRRSTALLCPFWAQLQPCVFCEGHMFKRLWVHVLIVVVQLVALIDPDSPTRLDVASRVASVFKRGNG